MVPGSIFKTDLRRNNISLTIAAKRLNISIPELQDLFLQELTDEYYYELCKKTDAVNIVPYGISLKALEKYNDMIKKLDRANKSNEELIKICKLQQNKIDKQTEEIKANTELIEDLNQKIEKLFRTK